MGDNFQRKKLLLPAGEQVSSSVKVYERCFVVQSKSRTFLPYSLILFPYQTFGTIPLCVRLRFHRSKEKKSGNFCPLCYGAGDKVFGVVLKKNLLLQ